MANDPNIIPISDILDVDDKNQIVFLESSNKSGKSIMPSKLPSAMKTRIKQHYPDIVFIEKDIEFGPLVEKSDEPGISFISSRKLSKRII